MSGKIMEIESSGSPSLSSVNILEKRLEMSQDQYSNPSLQQVVDSTKNPHTYDETEPFQRQNDNLKKPSNSSNKSNIVFINSRGESCS